MKPGKFEYRAAESVDEAAGLLAEYGDESKVIAGGQSLVPLMNLRLARPSALVDINPVGSLGELRCNGDVVIGSMVRHRQAERSQELRAAMPVLCHALSYVGHPAIRTRGTIGGSVAHSDPAAELPTVLTALDATVVARSLRGERTIPAGEFFTGFLTTALEPDEIVTAVRIDGRRGRWGWGFEEFSRRHGDFAVVGVAALLEAGDGDRIADARLVFSGVGATPARAQEAEAVLRGESASPEVFREALAAAAGSLDPPGDLHGSAAYRRHLATVLGEQALSSAWERARGEQR